MKRPPAAVLVGLSVVLISAAAFPQAAPQPQAGRPAATPGGAPLVFRNQVVLDQQGLGLEYLRMLIPKDWVFNGGISWNFAKNPPEAFLIYTAASPDGNSVIQQFPYASLYWSPDQQLQYSFSQMGSTIMQTLGAIDFLQRAFIPQVRQGVSDIKVLETQPLPAAAQKALSVTNLTLNLFGQISPPSVPYQTRADAGRVKVEYTANGRRIIEDFAVIVTYYITNSPTLSGMVVPSVSWSPTVVSFRCPAEEMPAKIRTFQIALMSRYDNPVWQVSYTRLCALVTREKLRQQQAIFARYQQIHKTLEECNDIIWQTYQNKSAAEDRMFDGYSQALRGVDTYVDPVNKWNVELPTGYDNAWTNGTDYVFSDSASFDPNVLSTGSWQKMTRKR
jgi:hypothetical protein